VSEQKSQISATPSTAKHAVTNVAIIPTGKASRLDPSQETTTRRRRRSSTKRSWSLTARNVEHEVSIISSKLFYTPSISTVVMTRVASGGKEEGAAVSKGISNLGFVHSLL
jgi:hypothetical protein